MASLGPVYRLSKGNYHHSTVKGSSEFSVS